MTHDEIAFTSHLDADPFDHVTRLVYADWLADRGRVVDEAEQRGLVEGWAAIELHKLEPYEYTGRNTYEWWDDSYRAACNIDGAGELPEEWFDLLEGCKPWPGDTSEPASRDYDSLRDAYTAAARAFTKLPADRRAELLRGPAVGA